MNEKTLGALRRIIEEVEEKRRGDCLMKNCIVNHMIGGDDIDIVKALLKEDEAKKIKIPFSEEDLQELMNGKTFDWRFDGIEVKLYQGEEDE